eukprot:CAMPEP_0168577100 /NCGR_PEP_ID=MMETSP0413-20121227/20603_1 /TAXON_ID=136452 /ORGANISM="Filamoeba nolandi, Strain NC-AS-23-1" /LENGTH=51 /DNA_ID=CAMNT_0008610825 /DNA_START=12 /DNA_END=163 /DNA_ORIENTATION=-
MKIWYDMGNATGEDENGLNESAGHIKEIIEREATLISPDKILLFGFAQGGA